MLLVLSCQAFLADQHLRPLLVGALDAHPGGHGLASLLLARLAVLVARLVLGDDPGVPDPRLQLGDLLQDDPVLDPEPSPLFEVSPSGLRLRPRP